MTKNQLTQIIIGALSHSMGYQDRVLPRGYGNGQPGEDDYTEERWCFDRVEAAIGKYTEPYIVEPGYQLSASKQLRRWLSEIYWDSRPFKDYGDHEWFVNGQIRLFRHYLTLEVKANPRPKVFEVA